MQINKIAASIAVLVLFTGLLLTQPLALAQRAVTIFLDGREITSDVPPVIINGRTMVPLRAISEGMGMDVQWDADNYRVFISSPTVPVSGTTPLHDENILIRGNAVLTADQLRALMIKNNPAAPRELPDYT